MKNEVKQRLISFKCTDDEWEIVNSYAHKQRMSMSEWMREAIKWHKIEEDNNNSLWEGNQEAIRIDEEAHIARKARQAEARRIKKELKQKV